jgi:putative methionine-R-sulfoxide reductase with GAF domain
LKRYRSPREVLAEIEKLVAARPSISAPLSVLDETAELLYRARNYSWIGIFLHAGEELVRQASRGAAADPDTPQTRSTIVVPIKIVGRELGAIEAESEREYAFGRQERVLLERVAARLARYLATRGKHVLRRLREQTQPTADAAAPAVAADLQVAFRRTQPFAAKKSVKPSKPSLKPSGRAGLRPASGATSH